MNLMDAKKIHKVVSPSTQKKHRIVLMLMLEYSKFWLMWILGFVDRSDLNLSHKLNKCFLAFALLALTSKSNLSFCSLCWWIESVIYPAFVWRLKRLSLTDLISILASYSTFFSRSHAAVMQISCRQRTLQFRPSTHGASALLSYLTLISRLPCDFGPY